MAKVEDNLIIEGISGKLGKRLVLRRLRDGRTILATRPNFSNHKWTAGQQTHHARFKEAAAYARLASKSNPLYTLLAAGTPRNAYNIALSDWFHPPVIHQALRQVGSIRANVTDDVQVTRVRITISDEEGNVLEQGLAQPIEHPWWEYVTATQGRVVVEALDLAHHVARYEI